MDVDTYTMPAVTEERGDHVQLVDDPVPSSSNSADTTTTERSNPIVVDDVLVTLTTSDEKKVTMSRTAACNIKAWKDLIEDLGVNNAIPVPNVTEEILLMIKEYAEYKVVNPNPPEPIPDPKKKNAKPIERKSEDILPWDKAFMARFNRGQIFDLLIAVNCLEFKDLFDLGTATVANMIKGKSPDEICEAMGIVCDFTPEEQAANIAENSWCDERL